MMDEPYQIFRFHFKSSFHTVCFRYFVDYYDFGTAAMFREAVLIAFIAKICDIFASDEKHKIFGEIGIYFTDQKITQLAV